MSGRFPTLEPHKPSRSRHNQNQQTLPRRAELGGGYLPVMRLALPREAIRTCLLLMSPLRLTGA